MDLWNAGGLILFVLSLFRPLKSAAIDFKYRYYKRKPSRNKVFPIREEPNNNKYCEPFSPRESFIAHFIDHNQNVRFTYFMKYDLVKVRKTIDILHNNLLFNIGKCDELQDYLETHPSDNNKTSEYERYNHVVKEDLSSIRKLESFLKVYDTSYIPKPEYPGEERDNVNTY